jgi:hypothetical protein
MSRQHRRRVTISDGVIVPLDGQPRIATPMSTGTSVDSLCDPLLSFAPPVADCLQFLADLLAAEVLRDMTRGNDAA